MAGRVPEVGEALVCSNHPRQWYPKTHRLGREDPGAPGGGCAWAACGARFRQYHIWLHSDSGIRSHRGSWCKRCFREAPASE